MILIYIYTCFYSLLFQFQTKGEETKNHKVDSEDLSQAGMILFHEDKYGYNPGEFLSYYIKSTSSKLDRLFQKPQRKAKWFDIHDLNIVTLFENQPIGNNMVGKMLKRICSAAGLPDKWTNHSLRATGITTLRSLGFSDLDVIKLSGKNYTLIQRKYPKND